MIAAIGSSAYLTRRTAPLLRELNGMESPCSWAPTIPEVRAPRSGPGRQ